MKEIADRIAGTVDEQAQQLMGLSEEELSLKKTASQWSPKEVIGHLIDSAQNNIQRFVRAQYENVPKIVYAQDDWVRLEAWQQCPAQEVVALWVALNHHLCRILLTMDPANTEKQCDTGDAAPELKTLSFLADDYHKHMLHHLKQVHERIKKA